MMTCVGGTGASDSSMTFRFAARKRYGVERSEPPIVIIYKTLRTAATGLFSETQSGRTAVCH